MPRFSLVIPTLRRADTLRHSLATLVRQEYEDCEIIIQNNGRDPATEAVVTEFHDNRIRHCFSTEVLTMTDNWELALTHTTGDFITFIGDDDGLHTDACGLALRTIDATKSELISWIPNCYYWPGCLAEGRANRIHASVDYKVRAEILFARNELANFYSYDLHFSHLPSIYYAFVGRSIIDRVTAAQGRYFIGLSPDVASGIVNLSQVSHFARISRPLSLIGISKHSTGTNFYIGDGKLISNEQMKRDFGAFESDDGRLAVTRNLDLYLAIDMLGVADKLALSTRGITLDFRRLIRKLADSINDNPMFYNEMLAAIRSMAATHRIDTDELHIPARAPSPKPPPVPRSARSAGAGKVAFDISGDKLGLANIADAVKLMEEIMPSPSQDDRIELKRPLIVRGGDPVAFGDEGIGVEALLSGWGRPAPWGVRSMASHASLRFAVESTARFPLVLTLRHRVFLENDQHQMGIRCRSNGMELAAWMATTPGSFERVMTLPREAVNIDGIVELKFDFFPRALSGPITTAADPRRGSMGLEALTVSQPTLSARRGYVRRALGKALASVRSRSVSQHGSHSKATRSSGDHGLGQ